MSLPRPPLPGTARAGRPLLPGLAAAHLFLFAAVTKGAGSARGAGVLVASAAGVLVFLLLRDRVAAGRRDRPPDIPSLLAWAGAGLLELHTFLPAVAASRIVPALLFPLFPLALRPGTAAGWGLLSLSWLLFPGNRPPDPSASLGLTALALLGTAAGVLLRGRLLREEVGPAGPARGRPSFRDLLIAWADPTAGPAGADRPTQEDAEISRRAEEIGEGIGRILQGLLPLSGADRLAFVVRSPDPGRPFQIADAAARDAGAEGDRRSIPDSFVPLREAFLFGRSFFADGAEAAAHRHRQGDGSVGGIGAVPVLVEGRVEGALLAVRDETGRWSEPVIPLLEMGARFAAREIETARRLQDEARARIRQESFHALFRRVAELAEKEAGTDPSDPSLRRGIYGETADRVREHLGIDRVLLVEADEGMSRGRLAALAVAPSEGQTGRPGGAGAGSPSGPAAPGEGEGGWVPLEGTYLGWVLRNGVTRSFTALGASPTKHPVLPSPWSDRRDEACLIVPVTGAVGFRGLLACASATPRPFSGADAAAAADFLQVMRMGLSHVRQIEELGARATTDGLTGLLNRKAFLERLGAVLHRLDGRHPAAVVMLDLDHFKRINDSYGHPAGDEVLRRTASVIGKTIRKMDFAGRYGGEEFIVFLSPADLRHALQVAERLRLAVRRTRFHFGGREVAVSASLGVACHPAHGRTAEEILRKADEALYRSKAGGRDRVTGA